MSRTWILVLGITLIAALLRFFNLSPFTVYPDSFQNLMVAHNLQTYGSVSGFLGANGMFYPDYFMWTRPLFPFLINAISSFGLTPMSAARSIAFVLGIMAIPLSYLLGKTVFVNKKAGLIAALLLALSFNHTVWSGLLMTEAIGIFCMLLFLWQFLSTVAKTTGFLKVQNVFTGVLFAIAVLARYEYAIIALPVVLYTVKKSSKPYIYLLTLFGTSFIVLAIVGYFFYPLSSVVQVLFSQMSDLLLKIGIAICFLILSYVAYRFLPKHYRLLIAKVLPAVFSIVLGLLFVLFIFVLGFKVSFIFGCDVSMFRDFFKHDFLISFFAFIGLLKLLEEKKQHPLVYFVLLSLVLLGFIYYHINPEMERYMTHLIPFLLIPAGYGITFVLSSLTSARNSIKSMDGVKNFDKQVYIPLVSLLVIAQVGVTAYGLRNLNDPSWFHPSYEEKAALLTRQHLSGNPLLITSFPEPYFYFLQKDTQSIADTPPFIYIPQSQNNRTVVIVEDMGMRDVFPNFTKVLDTKLQKYRYATFSVNEWYHYTNRSVPENKPVELYKIRLRVLKRFLDN